MNKCVWKGGLLALVAWLAQSVVAPVQAGVVLDRTRLVYPAQDREVTVQVTNSDPQLPRLVQVWVDDGSSERAPEQQEVPFNVTPPVFRLESGAAQALRVMYSQEPLPTDKESLYWLNVLEIAPYSSDEGLARNALRLAFDTRIKLFFRPSGLAGSPDDAPKQLQWRLVQDLAGHALEVSNPSAYHVSFATVEVAQRARALAADARMVAPGQALRIPLGERVDLAQEGAEVRFKVINDYGAKVAFSAALNP